MDRHIALVGEMGVGKTSCGAMLARKLVRPFHDSDQLLEADFGSTGAEIALEHGVDELHRRELEVFLSAARFPEPSVIAPAASVVDSDRGRSALESMAVIWLVATEAVLVDRRESGNHRRPVDDDERRHVLEKRREWLRANCLLRIETSHLGPLEVAKLLAEGLVPPG